MSDADVVEEVVEAVGPAPEPVLQHKEPGFLVVELRTDVHGVSHATPRHFLPAKVYQRSTAIKWAAYEAKKYHPDLLLVVVAPGGRGIAVVHGSTGKPAKPLVSLRAKRAVTESLPGSKRQRRTSRPVSKRHEARKRLVSRSPRRGR